MANKPVPLRKSTAKTGNAPAKAAPASKPTPTIPGGALKGTTITAKRIPAQKSALSGGAQVPTKRIDSLKKANPSLGKAIGGGYKGSGGMTTYGPDASDAIRKGLGGSKADTTNRKGK